MFITTAWETEIMTESALRTEVFQGEDFGETSLIARPVASASALPHPNAGLADVAPFRKTLPFLNGRLKRTMDILLVLLSAPLAVILLGLAALAIKLTSRGPVFFVQERLGRNGIPFPCYKLRTMVEGAEQGTPQWATESDPRVTPVGRFLRQSRLDELPQLYNVWRGDMSFVGMRPIRQHFARIFAEKEPLYSLRFLARPGLTGWDQVHNSYPSTVAGQLRKFRFDLYYLQHASFWLDLVILGKTIMVILGRKGQ
jgi:lipopolysaccharide/colanic/teichoic acid biosynthesis glycosyltransferase